MQTRKTLQNSLPPILLTRIVSLKKNPPRIFRRIPDLCFCVGTKSLFEHKTYASMLLSNCVKYFQMDYSFEQVARVSREQLFGDKKRDSGQKTEVSNLKESTGLGSFFHPSSLTS